MNKHFAVGMLVMVAVVACGCSSDDDEDGAGGSAGASGTAGSGGSTAGSGGSGGSTTNGGSAGSTAEGGSGAADGGSGGSVAEGGSGGTTADGGTGGTTTDPYAAERAACVAKVNEFRATKGLPSYAAWTSAESCADEQVTQDEVSSSPHGAYGACGEVGQNECLGGGASGIESCLASMWAEKDQAGCAGCDACAGGYDPNCPNCDFYGSTTGDVCGHYVNMSAKYFSQVACGFSEQGGWAVIDFR